MFLLDYKVRCTDVMKLSTSGIKVWPKIVHRLEIMLNLLVLALCIATNKQFFAFELRWPVNHGTPPNLHRQSSQHIQTTGKVIYDKALWAPQGPWIPYTVELEWLNRLIPTDCFRECTGRWGLNGAVELTRELRTLSGVIRKAQVCFSKLKYTRNVHKWRFDKDRNKKVIM